MAKKHNSPNLLDMVPVQNVEWNKKDDGKVTLEFPKLRSRLLRTIIKRMGVNPFAKVHLDEFGSFVWEQCDGNQPVYQIGKNLKSKFGDSIEPVYDRLGLFIRQLASQNCLIYKDNLTEMVS